MTNQYDTIRASMDATIQSIRALNRDHVAERHRMGYELADYLRQCKTMGFHIPRQCGATLWIMQQLIKSEEHYVFTQSAHEKFIVANQRKMTPFAWITDAPDPAALTKAQVKRIRSWIMLGNYIKENRPLPTPPKLVLIQDASIAFDKIRITKFYEWLANHPGVDEATEVILVN